MKVKKRNGRREGRRMDEGKEEEWTNIKGEEWARGGEGVMDTEEEEKWAKGRKGMVEGEEEV